MKGAARTCARVLKLLLSGPTTAVDASVALQVPRETVMRHLEILVDEGVAERAGHVPPATRSMWPRLYRLRSK